MHTLWREAPGPAVRAVSQRARPAHRGGNLPAVLERLAAKADTNHQSLRPRSNEPRCPNLPVRQHQGLSLRRRPKNRGNRHDEGGNSEVVASCLVMLIL